MPILRADRRLLDGFRPGTSQALGTVYREYVRRVEHLLSSGFEIRSRGVRVGRGRADVNGDGRVEYSEMAAFLTSANRQVTDPRARLTTLVVAPKAFPRAPIVDTRGLRTMAHLTGQAHHLGRFQIDDQRGNRLLDLRAEAGFVVDLQVPAEPVIMSNESGEISIVAQADHPTNLEEIVPSKARVRSRGAVSESMRRGLFAAEFGPAYYRGFVDSSDSPIVPVDLSPAGVRVAAPPAHPGHHHAALAAFAVGGAFVVTSGVFAILTAQAYADFQNTNLERASTSAHDRYERYGGVALAALGAGVISGALGYWLWNRDTVAITPQP
jgi:hypothetical protein